MARSDYFTKLRMGTAHETYNPEKEGYGDSREWASMFNVRMGFKEAQEHKAHGTRRASWGSDWSVLGEIAGVHVDENSMWSEIKAAFRKAAMNCHPDRVTQHGKSVEAATAEFKDASAAFAMLEDIYRSKGRID
jgi:DnaJ-domain-containing protein 1